MRTAPRDRGREIQLADQPEIDEPEEKIPGMEEWVDGRVQRGINLRAKIVLKTKELMKGGNLIPTVDQISEGTCSKRSVFQHFAELQVLYEEALKDDAELRRKISIRAFGKMGVLPPQEPKEGQELSEDRKQLLKIFQELPTILVQMPRKSQQRRPKKRAPTT